MIQTIKIKRLSDKAMLPAKAHSDDAAYDLYVPQDFEIREGRQIVPMGFAMQLPNGYCAEIHPRSGYASKGMEGHPCRMINYPEEVHRFDADVVYGLIDAGYRGQVGVIVHSHDRFVLRAGTRIAQIVIHKVESTAIEEVDEINETTRGENGFGSTNKAHV